ncbi:hypothetical protein QBC47DRAFT_429540 [Echria macrotheca]|uniref:Uncharacterized protein n=1 Tax=Echria macrotheca TaxID=438768 RepID=A0AAJ0B994_9PEZI|nr:hypothetical protein QBC47DRAFT_429540 [Echria macrotheca]
MSRFLVMTKRQPTQQRGRTENHPPIYVTMPSKTTRTAKTFVPYRETYGPSRGRVRRMLQRPTAYGGAGLSTDETRMLFEMMRLYVCEDLFSQDIAPEDVTETHFEVIVYRYLYDMYGKLDEFPYEREYHNPPDDPRGSSLTYRAYYTYYKAREEGNNLEGLGGAVVRQVPLRLRPPPVEYDSVPEDWSPEDWSPDDWSPEDWSYEADYEGEGQGSYSIVGSCAVVKL